MRFQLHTPQLLTDPERISYAGAAVEYGKHWTASRRCSMKGVSSLPVRRPLVRYFSETATGVPQLLLSRPPGPTAGTNAGQRLSNPWTQGPRTRRIKGPSPAARLLPESPLPSLPASRRSFGRRDGSRSRKPGARGCRCEELSGNWESTEPPLRNTWKLRVLRRADPGRVPRRRHLIPWWHKRVTFILNT